MIKMLLLVIVMAFAHGTMAQNTTSLTPVCGMGSGDTPFNNVGFGHWLQNLTNGDTVVCTYEENVAWMTPIGNDIEQDGANICQYLALALCFVNLTFYIYHFWKATTGWEEVYVVLIEMVKVCLELTHEYDSPASMYLSSGNTLLWIRYGEWLLSCPVILIHLSNITGLNDQYNKRTMMLLVSDLGCIVMGVTAAACSGWPKWLFFSLGMAYGCNTYFHAAQVYLESYRTVPKGTCRRMVVTMACVYFSSWTMFPILFAIGPEGVGAMTRSGSAIAHTVADIFSKQIWSLLGHLLRVKIHEYVLIHGNLNFNAVLDGSIIEERDEKGRVKQQSSLSDDDVSSIASGSGKIKANRVAAWTESDAK